MMKVRVQVENRRQITVPLPFAFLRLIGAVVSSKFVWKQANRWVNYSKNKEYEKWLLAMDATMIRKIVRSFLAELKQHKGLVLVDVALEDGTKVKVQL